MWNDAMPLARLLEDSSMLDEDFYSRPAMDVAKDLLGKVIVHRGAAGRIVEVEAYLGLSDLAAHAAAGITARTRVLFGPPGRAYVYLIYGIHECLNLVAEPDGVPGCVLIRALDPLCGLTMMRQRRPAARKPEDLCSGPGKLTAAMGITRALNGANVTMRGDLFVCRFGDEMPVKFSTSARIGITKCADWPLRFYIPDSPSISR
jgi:DNA-3-methyladenine glycosylase